MYLYKYELSNIIAKGNHNKRKNIVTIKKNENVNAKGCPNYRASLLL